MAEHPIPLAVDSATAPGLEPRIDSAGIGAARIGRTVGQIRDALGSGYRIGSLIELFMVDLSALPVIRGQDTLYYLVFHTDEPTDDDDVPLLAVTDHQGVRTPEGIGPGSTLAEAAVVYGSPRLSYSVNDEMREYAAFPRYSQAGVLFRVAPGDTTLLAGRYATEGEWAETTEFDSNARVGMVFVELRGR